ncbi:LssY C-terminal domain-containing protein [Streptantibioticus rubrisoli]|uniref:LssY C-terminal domain-containing protein n=1 Tax=Streptantibioticus rubrisoli TaxID=1387313 RepID=A0ABT1PDC7_9ACTN|nr:LssY C-terminal domain-containing protein [Streptantibioticus rubrisoli]MCQ4043369.1 LssY C-terminal domain-containing protein [Streptantibioticus rubrisoli]
MSAAVWAEGYFKKDPISDGRTSPRSYRLTYGDTDQSFYQARRALLAMARVVSTLNLTPTERHAWRSWYTLANHRATIKRLHEGKVFEFGISSNGRQIIFRITPTVDQERAQVARRYIKYHCDRCCALIDISALNRKPCVLTDLFGNNVEVATELVCKDETACRARRCQRESEAQRRKLL